MATRDYLTPEYKLSHHGIICLDEFYRALRNWFSVHKYDFYENEYKTLKTSEGETIQFVWLGEKMIDDYRAYEIDVEMQFSKMQPVTKKGTKKVLTECDIKGMCRGFLKEDYEEQYSKTPMRHFLRAAYQKFIGKNIQEEVENGLKTDTKKLADEIKSFFRIVA